MSQILTPDERQGSWQTLGDHDRRIRSLEALQPCCGDSGGAFQTYGECILAEPSLAAYYPAQEASGDLINQVAGLGDGTPVTDTVGSDTYPLYQQPGAFGDYSVAFGGASGTVPTGKVDRFEFDGLAFFDIFKNDLPYTISMLIQPLTDQVCRIFEYWDGTANQWVFIDRNSSGQVAFTRTNGQAPASAATDLPVGSWAELRCTHDGTDIEILLNGVVVSSSATSTTTLVNQGSMALGNNRGTGTGIFLPFNGRIAHFAVFSDVVVGPCDLVTAEGILPSSDALAGMVLTADGAGGTYWAYPTVEVLENGV